MKRDMFAMMDLVDRGQKPNLKDSSNNEHFTFSLQAA